MKIHKFKLITGGLIIILLSLALIGGANRQGYCVPEFRKLSDDELYERGMRNYMNYLVSHKNNIPISRIKANAVIYPEMSSRGFYYPIWILNEKLTTEQYNEKIYEYGKTDVAKQDWDRFAKIMAFLNAKTVIDGLSPALKFSQRNNNFSFIYISGYVVMLTYDCCYLGDINSLKNYTDRYSKYSNLYEVYNNSDFRKPFWKPYVGWNERYLIMLKNGTQSSIQQINGSKKNRMATNIDISHFLPVSNCGKIDTAYDFFNY